MDLCLTNPNFSGTQLNSFESSIKKTKEIQLWNKGIEDWQLEKAIISKEKLDFLKEASPQQMEGKAFIEKALWFRLQLEKLRIPWTNGSDSILIKKERIIADSLNFINICNMHKVEYIIINIFKISYFLKGNQNLF